MWYDYFMSAAVDLSSFPFAQQQRFRFIESTLLWEGAIQRRLVSEAFGVAVNHVTTDFRIYKERFPKNLDYDQASRWYKPSAKFKPAFARGDPAEYLSFLLAYAHNRSAAMLPVLGASVVSAEAIPSPPVSIDRRVLRHVLSAAKHGTGIRIQYFSMSSSDAGTRTIWPHGLIHTGTQWHLRAFDDRRNAFRNFAIQRIGKLEAVEERSPTAPTDDKDWHELETLEVVPNPKLNEHQREIVGREYGMSKQGSGWMWTERIRRCMVGYFLNTYRLDTDEATPARSYLALRNKKELRKFFFPPVVPAG
jgi:hypothetical protein